MLTVEEVIEQERKAEQRRKDNAIQRKKRETRMRLTTFGVIAFLVTIFSPPGLFSVTGFCQTRTSTGLFKTLYVKATDILWVYGYYIETYENYKYLFEDTNSDDFDRQRFFLDMARCQYEIKNYKITSMMYKIYKARWPNAAPETIQAIDKRMQIIFSISLSAMGDNPLYMPRYAWIQQEYDKYFEN
jgi:hypothetical protein